MTTIPHKVLFAGLFGVIATVLVVASLAFTDAGVVSVDSAVFQSDNLCNEDYIEFGSCAAELKEILVMTKASVFTHQSIPAGKQMLIEMAAENDFTIAFTEDSSIFQDPQKVDRFDAVLFLNTDSVVFDGNAQKQAFRSFIEQGKGYIGIHGAATTHWNKDKWDWYRDLVGQRFVNHPSGPKQIATIDVVNKNHGSTAHLPDRWTLRDEWYNFESQPTGVTVLMNVDESTYTGGKMGDSHPIAWYQTFNGSPSWYTNLGHEIALYSDQDYRQHVLGGIDWVLGELD